MSDSASRLPDRPSLEQLRKQAKELLKNVRAGDASSLDRVRALIQRVLGEPTLADAQFVLAREYGFEHWAALAHHVDTVNPQGLQRFETLAHDVAEAYMSADVDRLREINWVNGTSFVWYREADRMHQQLPTWFASDARTTDQALNDARHLVARMSGFEDWTALSESMSSSPSAAATSSQGSPFYRLNREHDTMSVRGLLSDQHWEAIGSVIREQRIAGVYAGGITDAILDRLSRLEHITALHIGGGQLTDEGLKHLARLPGLQQLSLGGPRSRITDRGLDVLRHLKKLRRFSISWADQISDSGITNLAGAHDLEAVDLMGTSTGDGAIAALVNKPSLRKLATGRLVTDAGTLLLQRFPQFRTWHGGDIKYDLMTFEAEPTSLLLDGPFTDKGLANLDGLEGLFGLNLFWHATTFTSAGLSALSRLPHLGMLGCNATKCDDEAMQAIATIPALRMLMAQDTVATDDGFVALSRSQTIEYIWGRQTPNLTGRGFAALSSMPSLRGLAVSLHNVDDASLATLPRFPALRALMPVGLLDEGFRQVGRCHNLESLWMMYCRDTTDAATEYIAPLSQLKTYYAGHTRITDRTLELLMRMASLEKIELYSCEDITNAGVAQLASLPNLREFVIEGSRHVTAAATAGFAPHVRVSYSG